jgi:hypothetical protein
MRHLLGALAFAGWVAAQATQAPKVEPTRFAPMTFFDKKCVYCHMKGGEGYDPQALRNYSDKALLERLREMSDEKARAPLSDRELAALASWFRALGKQEPHIAWVSLRDGVYMFEATPGASLTSSSGTIVLEKETWVLSGVRPGEWPTVTATKGRKKTVLDLSKAAVSHPKLTAVKTSSR